MQVNMAQPLFTVKKKRKKCFLKLKKSTTRGFRKRYKSLLKKVSHKMKLPKGKLVNLGRGRPTIHSKKHDNLVKKFLKATRYKGGVVNSSIAIAKAKELTKRYPLPEKDNLELGISWTNFMAFSREQALHDARQLLVRSQYLLVLKKNQSRNSCTNS